MLQVPGKRRSKVNPVPDAAERYRLFRFTIRHLILVTLVVAIAVAMSLSRDRKFAMIRAAKIGAPVHESYGSFSNKTADIKNIAVLHGSFKPNDWLVNATLLEVRAGQAHEINTLGISDSRIRIYLDPPMRGGLGAKWVSQLIEIINPKTYPMEICLALGVRETANGRIVLIGSNGSSRCGGSFRERTISIPDTYCSSYTGTVNSGREYIIYAEGDTEIVMSQDMTLSEFSKQNTGNYLVVTAQLR